MSPTSLSLVSLKLEGGQCTPPTRAWGGLRGRSGLPPRDTKQGNVHWLHGKRVCRADSCVQQGRALRTERDRNAPHRHRPGVFSLLSAPAPNPQTLKKENQEDTVVACLASSLLAAEEDHLPRE